MRRIIVILAGLAALAAAVAGPGVSAGERSAGDRNAADAPTPKAARTRTVSVRDNVFRPRRLTVRRRDVVRFVWRRTRNPHNVTARGRASRTTSRSGYVYRRRFSRTTRVICTVHPDTMRLTVRVRR